LSELFLETGIRKGFSSARDRGFTSSAPVIVRSSNKVFNLFGGSTLATFFKKSLWVSYITFASLNVDWSLSPNRAFLYVALDMLDRWYDFERLIIRRLATQWIMTVRWMMLFMDNDDCAGWLI